MRNCIELNSDWSKNSVFYIFPTYGKTSVHRGSYGKKQGNFYVFFYFSGFEKVRRLIISLKGVEKGNFPLSLSVKTPRPPYGASP